MFAIDHLPHKPGCYLFMNNKGVTLYVGKAKDLKKRVISYQHQKEGEWKTPTLLSQINHVDFIITETENEALILENNLIKKYQPKYNIRLKDAKGFSYIRLTYEHFPRVVIARQKQEKGDYYGPFVSAAERDYILQFLQKTFHIRTCKRLPIKPCLRYHIKLCDGPCIRKISEEDYINNIKTCKQILQGHIDLVIKNLEKEMKSYSDEQYYEKAMVRRNQIQALTPLKERQNMQRQKHYNEDIINYLVDNESMYVMIFNIYKGTLTNKQDYMFYASSDAFEEFIVHYYTENQIPKEIILPHQISIAVQTYLSSISNQKINVHVPQKGVKKQLLDLVKKNIEITFFANTKKLSSLQQKLRLHEIPSVIECFDISHLSGTSMAGSMVQFRNGKPDKSNYRRFRIRTVEGIDDVSAIGEIIRRRYYRLQKENQMLPNLIIIDGGKGQLNRAIDELNKLNMTIPIISIAKKFEEIYRPGIPHPLTIQKKDPTLHFLQEIRDEAHRFAISYNKLLRKKEMIA
jgi:excinuclease ABC subunit C